MSIVAEKIINIVNGLHCKEDKILMIDRELATEKKDARIEVAKLAMKEAGKEDCMTCIVTPEQIKDEDDYSCDMCHAMNKIIEDNKDK